MQFLSVGASVFQLLPLIVIWLVGIVLAIVTWGRHPQVSALVLIAFVLFLIDGTVGTFLGFWMPAQLGRFPREAGVLLTVQALLRAILNIVAWILLLAAIFAWRGSSSGAAAAEARTPST